MMTILDIIKRVKTRKPYVCDMYGKKIYAGDANIYADIYSGLGKTQYFSNDPIYTILEERNGYYMVRHHSLTEGITGWFKKSDVTFVNNI